MAKHREEVTDTWCNDVEEGKRKSRVAMAEEMGERERERESERVYVYLAFV